MENGKDVYTIVKSVMLNNTDYFNKNRCRFELSNKLKKYYNYQFSVNMSKFIINSYIQPVLNNFYSTKQLLLILNNELKINNNNQLNNFKQMISKQYFDSKINPTMNELYYNIDVDKLNNVRLEMIQPVNLDKIFNTIKDSLKEFLPKTHHHYGKVSLEKRIEIFIRQNYYKQKFSTRGLFNKFIINQSKNCSYSSFTFALTKLKRKNVIKHLAQGKYQSI